MRCLTRSLLLLLLTSVAIAQDAAKNEWDRRLAALRSECAAARAKAAPLSDSDLDLLEAAQFDQEAGDGELAATAALLRFGAGLAPADWPALATHGLTAAADEPAWPLIMLLTLHSRLDDAARLAVAAAARQPKGERAVGLWQPWEAAFGTRDDHHTVTRDFSLALLQQFEHGTDDQRAAIGDLLNRDKLTAEGVAELRTYVALAWQRQEDERRAAAPRDPAKATVWVEDRKGLRQIPRTQLWHLRRPVRRELRLLAADGVTQWGTLADGRGEPEDLTACYALLCDLRARSAIDFDDLAAAPGPVEIVQRRQEESPQLEARLATIADATAAALGTCAAVVILADLQLPADPQRSTRIAATVATVLAAVHDGARRVRQLTVGGADQGAVEGDAPAMKTLQSVHAAAAALLHEFEAAAAPPAGTCHDMVCHRSDRGGADARLRTHVAVYGDRVWIVEFEFDAATEGAPCIGLQTTVLGIDELHDARFEAGGDDAVGACTLLVTLGRSTFARTLDLPHGERPAAIHGDLRERLAIACDTPAHRVELQTELQQLATRDRR